MKQNILRLNPQEIYCFDNFYFGENTELASALLDLVQNTTTDYLYLCAPSGEGKSHLLMATQQAAQQAGKQVAYFALDVLVSDANPVILEGAEQADIVCLDAMESVAGYPDWEEAVFHLFNRLKASGSQLLVAASAIPSDMVLSLADLRSRLETGTHYQLSALMDSDKQQALQKQAAYRGLSLADNVADYLLRHYGRDMVGLMAVLKRLDEASLAEKRRLTIPFIQQVIV